MDKKFLGNTALFGGLAPQEVRSILPCLGAAEKAYPRGSVILHEGDIARSLGLVLQGSVRLETVDAWGSKSILGRADAGQVFAETYACLPQEKLMVSAVAAEDCRILFLEAARILQPCSNACPFHTRLAQNLLHIFARKNLQLSRRIFHTRGKTIRSRLLSYLSHEATANGTREFDIPYDRQGLADYLGVDRSALSAELSKMQREGLIAFRRSHFELLQTEEYE